MPARIPSMSRPRSASPSRCTTRMCRTSPVGCATHPCPHVQLELLQRAAALSFGLPSPLSCHRSSCAYAWPARLKAAALLLQGLFEFRFQLVYTSLEEQLPRIKELWDLALRQKGKERDAQSVARQRLSAIIQACTVHPPKTRAGNCGSTNGRDTRTSWKTAWRLLRCK
jgi:hypothetical protein